MQILFPPEIASLAALTPAEQVAQIQQTFAPVIQILRENAVTLALLFGLGQVLAILSYWVVSKIVAQEEGSFVNALKNYFFVLGMCLLVGVAGGFTVSVASRLNGQHAIGTDLISGGLSIFFGLLMIASFFAAPMKVYKITFPKAIAFVVLAIVIQLAGNLALNNTLGRDVIGKESPLQKALLKIVQSAAGQSSAGAPPVATDADSDEKIAADKTKSIVERQAALSDLYGKLESMYQALPPGQTVSRIEYESRKARYERLLADLRDDAAHGR
jgi:hypothetical protein